MESLETVVREISAFEREINRRRFLKLLGLIAVIPPTMVGREEQKFLGKLARTLIPAEAVTQTGIDVVANIEYLLSTGSAEHRAKVMLLIAWANRVSFLYGGEKVALRARNSKFVLLQKMSKALSSLCLVAFWGDERAMRLIDIPKQRI